MIHSDAHVIFAEHTASIIKWGPVCGAHVQRRCALEPAAEAGTRKVVLTTAGGIGSGKHVKETSQVNLALNCTAACAGRVCDDTGGLRAYAMDVIKGRDQNMHASRVPEQDVIIGEESP